jgi:benzoyl-CoA reductase/2-hydroxyglutaryl-CoA dehydratase subunit BcrC/BadD/HgdB
MTASAQDREPAEIFESLAEARRDGFIAVKKFKEQGRGVAGILGVHVPVELFTAAGLVPVQLTQEDREMGALARNPPPDLCLPLGAVRFSAAAGTCPYMYFSDLVVGEDSCAGMAVLFGALKKIKEVHVVKLPRSPPGESAGALRREEILILQKKIEEKFHSGITETKLREAVREQNRERTLVTEFCELFRAEPPALTGLQRSRILYGIGFRFDRRKRVRELEEIINRIKEGGPEGRGAVSEQAKRIILTGCPLGRAEPVIRLIEESGAVVVYEDRGGSYGRLVSQTGDTCQALGDYYLGPDCGAVDNVSDRLESLDRLCARFAAEGIIEISFRFCRGGGTWAGGKLPKVRGLPILSLEGDYINDTARLKARIAAFIKIL